MATQPRVKPDMKHETETPEIDYLTDEEIENVRQETYSRAVSELGFSDAEAKFFSDTFAKAALRPQREK